MIYNPQERFELYKQAKIQGLRWADVSSGKVQVETKTVEKDVPMTGMMKSKIAYESQFGNNPAIERMLVPTDNPYKFDDGSIGTHFMGSHGQYAVPHIQDVEGQLELTGPRKEEAIKFRTEEEAESFAKYYKDVAPALKFKEEGEVKKEKSRWRKGLSFMGDLLTTMSLELPLVEEIHEKTDIDKSISNYTDKEGNPMKLTSQQQLDIFGTTSQASYNLTPLQESLFENVWARGYETTQEGKALQYTRLEDLKNDAKNKLSLAQKNQDTKDIKYWTDRLQSYEKGKTSFERVWDAVYHGESEFITQGKDLYGSYFNNPVQKSRMDAYRIYMGQPMLKRDKNGRWEGDPNYDQKSGNYKRVGIGASDFKPTKSGFSLGFGTERKKSWEGKQNNYYIDKRVSNNLKASKGNMAKNVIEFLQENKGNMSMQSFEHGKTKENPKYMALKNKIGEKNIKKLWSPFMGGYTLKLDADKDGNKFLVYQDVFDIEPLGKDKWYKRAIESIVDIEIGQPFNLYDRIYYKENKGGGITIIDSPKEKKKE